MLLLSNTANDRFTHWTYWVRPTAPLVSGGAQHGLNPDGTSCPRPSKLLIKVGARASGKLGAVLCNTGSGASGSLKPSGKGMRRSGSASCVCGEPWDALAALAKSRNGGETSCCTFCLVINTCPGEGRAKPRKRTAMAGMKAKERYRFKFKMDDVWPENWMGTTIGLTNPPLKNRSGAGFFQCFSGFVLWFSISRHHRPYTLVFLERQPLQSLVRVVKLASQPNFLKRHLAAKPTCRTMSCAIDFAVSCMHKIVRYEWINSEIFLNNALQLVQCPCV